MAHNTEQAGFPAIPLQGGMKIRIRALSPTTDAAVTGVVFQQWSIYGYDESEPEEPADPTVEWVSIPLGD